MPSDCERFSAFEVAGEVLAELAYTDLFRFHIAYPVYTIAYFGNRCITSELANPTASQFSGPGYGKGCQRLAPIDIGEVCRLSTH